MWKLALSVFLLQREEARGPRKIVLDSCERVKDARRASVGRGASPTRALAVQASPTEINCISLATLRACENRLRGLDCHCHRAILKPEHKAGVRQGKCPCSKGVGDSISSYDIIGLACGTSLERSKLVRGTSLALASSNSLVV